MTQVPDGLTTVLRSLAQRITSSAQPTWPIPIFEAEAYLYKYFLRKLLTILDSLVSQPTPWPDIAAMFYMPSRVVEYCYLFLGLRFSDLDISERIRLATHLIEILSSLRPDGTFCQDGVNRLVRGDHVRALVSAQCMVTPPAEILLTSRLSAALFSLCELIHIGIPQYGREIHGPYVTDPARFTLIRTHYNLRFSELWPPLEKFPFDEIEIVETYRGTPDMVRIDFTNHLIASAVIHDRLERVLVRGRLNGVVRTIEHWQWLLQVVVDSLDECFKSCHSFTRLDWLRKHLEARCAYLRPHCEQISHPVGPTPREYEHLEDPPLDTGIERTRAGTLEEMFALMCSDFGMQAS